MKKQELDEFLTEAIDYVEENNIDKAHFAKWLAEKYKIALGEIQVSIEDGSPYLYAQHIDDTADLHLHDEKVSEPVIIETWISMKKYEDKLRKKMEEMGEMMKNADSK